jgi:hypothetical protein
MLRALLSRAGAFMQGNLKLILSYRIKGRTYARGTPASTHIDSDPNRPESRKDLLLLRKIRRNRHSQSNDPRLK